ncbi:hypothetical protein [Methylobacterium sp. SyP6R]|uniref:hypothetical protein n=1 Tax=Methylobacterium sp. SyP6R TaxID=2718876 RepID=UPI001F2EC3F9|nr:hypothetical protein [Methylobacterium sp. SyP6R]MCF4125125.1 hypothetical protein [Methylobacterium sp. SyP6R]
MATMTAAQRMAVGRSAASSKNRAIGQAVSKGKVAAKSGPRSTSKLGAAANVNLSAAARVRLAEQVTR